MEDYQEYIESGRLEQYVLGELSPAAQAEVEDWAARFPQVREELEALEAGLGVYAEAHALAPPPAMRERVLSAVFAQIGPPAAPATPVAEAPTMRVSASNPHVAAAPVAAPAAGRSSGWAIAASVALLLSLVGNALLYSRWQQASESLVALENDQARVASTTQVLNRELTDTRQQLHVLRSPDEYKLVALAGTPTHPQAHARVLYSKSEHRVYLDVQQLPPLPAGKQYQLWALDKGKPIDAGMLTAATASGDGLQQMKDIASAQTFAMTIEPTGGSVNPTLNTMTVVGNI
ncbi:anti-sigma factor [Hymenobacter sp. RP-2-7]|uniref:Regulator of SigK n=1 Tax=Hymenobacter polaris TaxID=2682546 RepID=A0A7Y0ACR6_9BACT|nr:anti-sigma factor [Hymenobacter polaris]NML64802.1 anti-sigma factor [Hymenobacter polaris]